MHTARHGVTAPDHLLAQERGNLWLVLAALFTIGNFAGGIFAAVKGEMTHAAIHAGLMVLGANAMWQYAPSKRKARKRQAADSTTLGDGSSELSSRLAQIELAVESVALEVERIGEGQRFMTRLFTEKGAQPDAGKRRESQADRS